MEAWATGGQVLDITHALARQWIDDPTQWFKLEGLQEMPAGETSVTWNHPGLAALRHRYDQARENNAKDPITGQGRGKEMDPNSAPAIATPQMAALGTENESLKAEVADLKKQVASLTAAKASEKAPQSKGKRK